MEEKYTHNNKTLSFDKIFTDLTRSIKVNDEFSKAWIFLLVMFALVGLWGFVWQYIKGLGITGMRDYVSWAMYIGNFVFFVAVSLVGMLISSILHLLNIHWAKPAARVAEQIALAAVALAGIVIVMDMGRPDRLLNVFKNGRFASPILWDVTVITTYMVISALLFYLPLIPDLAILRDRAGKSVSKWHHKLYKTLALGWNGNPNQFKTMFHAIRVLAILIIPVGLSIHTVTSWLFASTLRAGWDSTIFGPYFVSGAFVAGVAAVIIAMFVYRKRYHLKEYFTDELFNRMGMLLTLMSLVYLYFNLNEFLVPGYKMRLAEGVHIRELFVGRFAGLFWWTQIAGLIVPIILLLFRAFRRPLPLMLISSIVLIAAWIKRYIIVVPTMEHPHLPVQNVPAEFVHYVPTAPEVMITLFPFFVALIIITALTKLFPVITMWEFAEDHGNEREAIFNNPENK